MITVFISPLSLSWEQDNKFVASVIKGLDSVFFSLASSHFFSLPYESWSFCEVRHRLRSSPVKGDAVDHHVTWREGVFTMTVKRGAVDRGNRLEELLLIYCVLCAECSFTMSFTIAPGKKSMTIALCFLANHPKTIPYMHCNMIDRS